MPECKGCGKKFSRRVIIEDKERILSNRVYCFECSPFGSKDIFQKRILNTLCDKDKLTCTICGKTYKYTRHGSTYKKCASCCVNRTKETKKLKMIVHKGGKCAKCGYEKCKKVLCFHHIDKNKKRFNLSGAHCRCWEEIEKELKNCVLLCMNCHGELHDSLWNLNDILVTPQPTGFEDNDHHHL